MRLCVIGDPVGHSLSPLLHRRMLDRAGLTGSYETVTVTPDTLPEFLAAARVGAWDGCNITMPLKQAILPLLDELDPAAAACGAVNTVAGPWDTTPTHRASGRGFWPTARTPGRGRC